MQMWPMARCASAVTRSVRRLPSAMSATHVIERSFSSVGEIAQATRTWTQADVQAFAALTSDDNPMHVDDSFSAAARFGRPIVHGMLYASMFGAIVGHRCPGAVYLSQTLDFRRPVHAGDTLTAEIEVRRVGRGGRLLDFATRCSNQEAIVVLDGTARVLMPRKRHAEEHEAAPAR